MSRTLALDVGSSSVKAAVADARGRIVGPVARAPFETRHDATRAEVELANVERAVADAVAQLGRVRVDRLACAAFAPSWTALDARGRALAPLVTHQDRRATADAERIERAVGRARHLRLAFNRPVPGGISSTTAAWFARERPGVLRRAAVVGHLQTALLFRWTGRRACDPGNAAFTGLWDGRGWNAELCAAAGLDAKLLPDVLDGAAVAGALNTASAAALGLPAGLPVLVGVMDTSAAALLTGPRAGSVVSVQGTTDVLALLAPRARPRPDLLTRPLGTGTLWMSVATLAAGGSALTWARRALFPDLGDDAFWKRAAEATRRATGVTFEPDLAGSRTSVEQPRGRVEGLTLAHDRDDVLAALLAGLRRRSAARVELLRAAHPDLEVDSRVLSAGGLGGAVGRFLRGGWPGGPWRFREVAHAGLRGLGLLGNGSDGSRP